MGLTRTTDGAEVVSSAEQKTYSKVTTTDDDDLVGDYVKAARLHLEELLNRTMIDTTWTLTLDNFQRRIVLPQAPASSITTLKYTDTGGTLQTLAATEYTLIKDVDPGYVVQAYQKTWPSTRSVPNAIEVAYVAGYGAAATNVPSQLKVALMMLADHWYSERSPVVIGMTVSEPIAFALDSMVNTYRVFDEAA